MVTRRPVGRAAVKPVHSDASEVEDLSRQVAEGQRAPNPFASGVVVDFEISDTLPSLGPRRAVVRHRLGRVPTGWLLLDLTCPYVLTAVARSVWDAATLTLYADRGCTGKALVF
jgi:hypothetical protein